MGEVFASPTLLLESFKKIWICDLDKILKRGNLREELV